MRIDNAKLLGILLKDVFGSITLNLERWDGLMNASFSIGRTYFSDHLKFNKPIPLNGAAAERLQALYRHALTEGSGCGYDAKRISQKLCGVLESLIPGEDFRHLIFLFSDKKEARSAKAERLLSILSLLLSLAENEKSPDLEKFRELYIQELKSEILKRLSPYADSPSEKQASSSSSDQKSSQPSPSFLTKKSKLYSEMMHHLAADRSIVPENAHKVSDPEKTFLENSSDYPALVYRLNDSVIYPDANFVGRETELDQIHKFLSSPNNKLFLFGMGGIGKSELARQYISRHRNDYRLVLWISVNGTLTHTLADDYLFPIRGMSRLDYPNDNEKDYFQRKCILLRELAGTDVLVVLDNYDSDDDAGLKEFLSGTYTALITTRILRRDSRLQEMPVPPLHHPEELRRLFQIEYIRLTAEEENEYIYRLASLLGGHPLSIRLAASVMRDRRMPPSRMFEILSDKKAANSPVLQTQEIIFNRIRNFFSISGLDQEEIFLLKNLACIPLSGIAVTELFEWCEFDNYDVLENLIQKSWIIHNQLTDDVHLHPVIASVLQEQIRMDDQDTRTLLRHYRQRTHKVRQDSLSEKERLLRYGEYMSDIGFTSREARRNLLIALGYMHNHFGHYAEAKNAFSDALLLCDQLVDRLEMYHKLSQMEIYIGNFGEGKTTALKGLEELSGCNIPDEELGHLLGCWKIELFMRLSGYSRKTKDADHCIQYATKALETANKVFTKDFSLENAGEYLYNNFHPSQFRGWIYYEFTSGYIVKADLEQAEIFALKSLHEFNSIKDVWSANYIHTLRSYIFYMKGEKENALKEALEAYHVLLPRYGKYAVGQNLLWLYQLYRDLGDAEEMETVIAKLNDLYHDDHDAIMFINMAKRADFLWDFLDFDTFPIPHINDLSKSP